MSPNTVPPATDKTIPDANQASEKKLTPEQAAQVQEYARRMLNSMTRHNTPFDGRKRNTKVAKQRRNRKANKKRKLYVRYGK